MTEEYGDLETTLTVSEDQKDSYTNGSHKYRNDQKDQPHPPLLEIYPSVTNVLQQTTCDKEKLGALTCCFGFLHCSLCINYLPYIINIFTMLILLSDITAFGIIWLIHDPNKPSNSSLSIISTVSAIFEIVIIIKSFKLAKYQYQLKLELIENQRQSRNSDSELSLCFCFDSSNISSQASQLETSQMALVYHHSGMTLYHALDANIWFKIILMFIFWDEWTFVHLDEWNLDWKHFLKEYTAIFNFSHFNASFLFYLMFFYILTGCIGSIIFKNLLTSYFFLFRQRFNKDNDCDNVDQYKQHSYDCFSFFIKPKQTNLRMKTNFINRVFFWYVVGYVLRTVFGIGIIVYLNGVSLVDTDVFHTKILIVVGLSLAMACIISSIQASLVFYRLKKMKKFFPDINDPNEILIQPNNDGADDEKYADGIAYHKNMVECIKYLSIDYHCTLGFAIWVWLRFLLEIITNSYITTFSIINLWLVLLSFVLWFISCWCLRMVLIDIHRLSELVAYSAWEKKYKMKNNNWDVSSNLLHVEKKEDLIKRQRYWFEIYFDTIKHNEAQDKLVDRYNKLLQQEQNKKDNVGSGHKSLNVNGKDGSDVSNTRIVFVDICNLKEINDRFGHDVGDSVLSQTRKRIFEIEFNKYCNQDNYLNCNGTLDRKLEYNYFDIYRFGSSGHLIIFESKNNKGLLQDNDEATLNSYKNKFNKHLENELNLKMGYIRWYISEYCIKKLKSQQHRMDMDSHDLRYVLSCFKIQYIVFSYTFICVFNCFVELYHTCSCIQVSDIKRYWLKLALVR